MGFIEKYCGLYKETEIPEMFSIWCSLTGISAVIGRSMWVDMGTFPVFPNIFTILVAGSGRCRKSSAIGQIGNLIKQVTPPINIMSQKTSPEGMIQAFHGDNPQSTSDAVGFVLADELIIFLNRAAYDAGLGGLLIQLYDCLDEFSYRTIARGKEELKNSCLGLLSGTTIDWLKMALPLDAIGSGLTSRILFVYLDKYAPPCPIPHLTDEMRQIKLYLVQQLQKYSNQKGEVKWTKQSRAYFKERYSEFYLNSPLFDDPTLSGYASRRNIHWLKLAMLFASSEGTPYVIKTKYLIAAEKLLSMTEQSLPQVMSMITSTDKGRNIEWVLQKIVAGREQGISRSDLSRSIAHRIDAKELDGIMETLLLSAKVDTLVVPATGRVKYIATIYKKKKKKGKR